QPAVVDLPAILEVIGVLLDLEGAAVGIDDLLDIVTIAARNLGAAAAGDGVARVVRAHGGIRPAIARPGRLFAHAGLGILAVVTQAQGVATHTPVDVEATTLGLVVGVRPRQLGTGGLQAGQDAAIVERAAHVHLARVVVFRKRDVDLVLLAIQRGDGQVV